MLLYINAHQANRAIQAAATVIGALRLGPRHPAARAKRFANRANSLPQPFLTAAKPCSANQAAAFGLALAER